MLIWLIITLLALLCLHKAVLRAAGTAEAEEDEGVTELLAALAALPARRTRVEMRAHPPPSNESAAPPPLAKAATFEMRTDAEPLRATLAFRGAPPPALARALHALLAAAPLVVVTARRDDLRCRSCAASTSARTSAAAARPSSTRTSCRWKQAWCACDKL
jgi:hypothetical protein